MGGRRLMGERALEIPARLFEVAKMTAEGEVTVPEMKSTMKPANLAQKLSTFSEHWQPRVIGQFNGHDVMVVKVKGELVWHQHDIS
jgi:hypothetical protein